MFILCFILNFSPTGIHTVAFALGSSQALTVLPLGKGGVGVSVSTLIAFSWT